MKIVNGAATKGTPGAWSAINQEWLYIETILDHQEEEFPGFTDKDREAVKKTVF